MKKRIPGTRFLYKPFSMVFIILISNAAVSFSAPLPNIVDKILRSLSDFQKESRDLGKTAQGQIPATKSPGSVIPVEYMEGLNEVKTQYLDQVTSQWRDSERDVVTRNEKGDITKVAAFRLVDSTQTWVPEYESTYDYHAKGKASSQTIKKYSRGQWIMESLLTVGYDQVDSPATFSQIGWDTARSAWDSLNVISGEITYAANGKMNRIVAHINDPNMFGYIIFTLTYLPDGRLNEEASGISSVAFASSPSEKVTHYYPDDFSEIQVTKDFHTLQDSAGSSIWLTTDSAFLRYNQAGQVIESQKFSCYGGCDSIPMKKEVTTYDSKNRPLARLIYRRYLTGPSAPDPNGLHLGNQILFYYDGQPVKKPSPRNDTKPGLFSIAISPKGNVVLKGLSNGRSEALIEFYDLKGAKVYATRVIAIDGVARFRMTRDLAKGYYSCVIKSNRMQTLGMMHTW
jgi:hypothetical protein